jgi:hypothetical protein
MPRALLIACHIAVTAALITAPGMTRDADAQVRVTVTKKYKGTRGYGFLPGYEPPYRTRRESYGHSPYVRDSTHPWYGYPGFYRGRFNGGGFGPCYTKTPIGPIWNCG